MQLFLGRVSGGLWRRVSDYTDYLHHVYYSALLWGWWTLDCIEKGISKLGGHGGPVERILCQSIESHEQR
jgi:hypothetical protein